MQVKIGKSKAEKCVQSADLSPVLQANVINMYATVKTKSHCPSPILSARDKKK
jgi:hypothetical protein